MHAGGPNRAKIALRNNNNYDGYRVGFGSSSCGWLRRHVRGTLLTVTDCKVLAVDVHIILTYCTVTTAPTLLKQQQHLIAPVFPGISMLVSPATKQ